MTASVRYWVMVAVLLAATAGLHSLSHGEDILLTKSLASVPEVLDSWHAVDAPLEPRIVKAHAAHIERNAEFLVRQKIFLKPIPE